VVFEDIGDIYGQGGCIDHIAVLSARNEGLEYQTVPEQCVFTIGAMVNCTT